MLQAASSLSKTDQSKLEGEELNKHISTSKDPPAAFPHFTRHSESRPNGTQITTPVREHLWNVKMLVKNEIVIKDAPILTEITETEQMLYVFEGSRVSV